MGDALFRLLREIRAYEGEHLGFIRRIEDRDLVWEIGYHQAAGRALSVKQVLLLGLGAPSTVMRRLRRLIRLHIVVRRRSTADRRVTELALSPKVLRAFDRYRDFLIKIGS